MKAFAFRLEQALRWRGTQVALQKSRVAAAAANVSSVKALLETTRAEAASSAADIIREPAGIALVSYAGFVQRSRARILRLEEGLAAGERALAVERDLLVVANRNLRLLENLKRSDQARWRAEFDRELSAFADEAFSARREHGAARAR